MNIGIVGAGKLGFSLALALQAKGQRIAGIYSRSPESSEQLNKALGLSLENDLTGTVRDADVIFITTPDTAIREAAEWIEEKTVGHSLEGKCFFHCSGALASDILDHLRIRGAWTASLHPLQTFADRDNGWKGLFHIYFGFEGSGKARETAEEIARLLEGDLLILEKQAKPLYHAAACILSNYMVTLSYVTEELLSQMGIPAEIGAKAFMPLLEKTLDNIKRLGSVKALTGPISRGDEGVVRQHLEAVKDLPKDIGEIYRVLGRKTADAAMEKGTIRLDQQKALKELLKG